MTVFGPKSCHLSKVLSALALAGASCVSAAQSTGGANWFFGGGDLSNSRSNPSTKINPGNVGQLALKWAYTTQGDVSATPTVEGSAVYAVDWGGYLHAINANTGAKIWSYPISTYTGVAPHQSIIGLPVISTSRTSPAIVGDNLVLGDQGQLDSFGVATYITGSHPSASVFAVNRFTGAPVWRTVLSNHPWSCITSSPVTYNGVVYVGLSSLEEGMALLQAPIPYTFQGKIFALNATTGAIIWQTTMAPPGFAGCSVWGSTPVVDAKRGSLYICTGNNYFVPHGTPEESGGLTDGNYVDAIVALDLNTGAIKWGKWMYGPDTWNTGIIYGIPQDIVVPGPDADFGSGPNLYSTNINGKLTDVLGAGEKSGMYWALNPNDGSTIWHTQVGPGGTAGGIEWGSSVDGQHVYCGISNTENKLYTTMAGASKHNGLWGGLDAATGQYLWQVPEPSDGQGLGMITSAGGVVFAGSTHGQMFAIDGTSGSLLWSYSPGGAIVCGPSVVNGVVYWGTGYNRFGGAIGGAGGNQVLAFAIPGKS